MSKELEIPQRTIIDVLSRELSPSERRAISASPAKQTYSDTELIGFLAQASAAVEGTLSAPAYSAFARTRRTPDGRRWPSTQTPAKRFGSWRNALLAAGLPVNPPSNGGARRRFNAEECLQAVRGVARSLGRAPTFQEYEQSARESGGEQPSGTTVRNHCGTWTDVLASLGVDET